MSAKSELYQLIELVEQKAEHTPRAAIDIPDLIAAQKQLKQFLVTFLAITLINRTCFITLQKSLTARQTVTSSSMRRSSSIRAPFRLSSAMSSARGSTTTECEVSWMSCLQRPWNNFSSDSHPGSVHDTKAFVWRRHRDDHLPRLHHFGLLLLRRRRHHRRQLVGKVPHNPVALYGVRLWKHCYHDRCHRALEYAGHVSLTWIDFYY